MRNKRFQLAVMNGTDPGVADIAAFEADLKNRRVKALLYNAQAISPLTLHLQKLARAAGIPAVHITETQPAGMSYQSWMMSQLEALDSALQQTAK
jgi:zinc/manganese transport system substrate-binding protein